MAQAQSGLAQPVSIQKTLISDGEADFSTQCSTFWPREEHIFLAQSTQSQPQSVFSDVDGIGPSLVPGTFILWSVFWIFANI